MSDEVERVKKEYAVKAAGLGRLIDPDDAPRYIDLDDVDVDPDGNVDADSVEKAIDSLIERKPYLASETPSPKRPSGSGDGGGRGSKTSSSAERISRAVAGVKQRTGIS